MLKALQTAIMARYNSAAGATLRGLTAGMWEDEAPSSVVLGTQKGEELENQPLPFIVFTTIFTDLEQDFCSNMFEPLVQFTIFDDGNNKTSMAALNVAREFLDVFGDQLFTMEDSYTMFRNDTVGQRKFKDSDKMWNIILELQFKVEKDR